MDISDVGLRYSGGAANSNPDNAIGGAMSSASPSNQTFGSLTNITGVTILEVGACQDGNSGFEFQSSEKRLRFKPPLSYWGPYVTMNGLGDRNYFLYGSEGFQKGFCSVAVVEASLPGTTQTDTVAISTPANELFPDILKSQAANGVTQYRCLYVRNNHGSDNITKLGIYIVSDTPGQDSIEVAIDTDAGVGGTATTLADENDSTNLLSGLSFSGTADFDNPVEIGSTIAAGVAIPIWIKRVVPENVEVEVINNDFVIGLKIYVDG